MKCDDCKNYEPKPKPTFAPGDWGYSTVAEELFLIAEVETGWLWTKDRRFGYPVEACRHARWSDFEKTVNGIKMVMQWTAKYPESVVDVWVGKGPYTEDNRTDCCNATAAIAIARALGVQIVPADFKEKG